MTPIIPKLADRLLFGADYNPEQWPESVWEEDLALMKEAGVNLVSLGIFAWAKLEPEPGRFEFDWLDRVMDRLSANGIFACLATATASPPPWFSQLYPESLPVNAQGVTLGPGSRQHYSPSSKRYREVASALARRIAERYAQHPALAAWHINNEYACHLPECHNAESIEAFRQWLEREYRSISELNDAWGTSFWSQNYRNWSEIGTPRTAPYFVNPAQQLDFKRFTSEAFRDLLVMEKRILNEVAPGVPVTTNFMGFFKPLDYWKWSEALDFCAWDSYPDPADEGEGRRLHAAGNDLTRSLRPGRPFVLMEQAPSAVNWRELNLPKRPGLMRLWSYQTVARGGDGVMFFQWRASRSGTEKFHSAIVPHGGVAHSRSFREVAELGQELDLLRPVAGSVVEASVAIAFDWNAWWAVEIDSRPGRIDYAATARWLHRWFYDRNIAIDFVAPGSELERYRLVVAPALYLIDAQSSENLRRYVERGGSLVATYFSGIVDENDRIGLGPHPSQLRELLGLTVEEWRPYASGESNRIRISDTESYVCDHWCDLLRLEGAEPLATFDEDYFAGRAAWTRHALGQGFAYYLATRPSPEGLDAMLAKVRQSCGVTPTLETPAGVEATVRVKDERRFLFLLNHNEQRVSVSLGEWCGRRVRDPEMAAVQGSVSLEPLGVEILELM